MPGGGQYKSHSPQRRRGRREKQKKSKSLQKQNKKQITAKAQRTQSQNIADNPPTGAISVLKRKMCPYTLGQFQLPSEKHHRFYTKIFSLRPLRLCGE
jgi:hypothetical protein